MQRRERRATQGDYSWDAVNWTLLVCLMQVMATLSGAVRVGLTRDGGAFALGLYLEGDYATEYIRPSEDFTEAILEIGRIWLPQAEYETMTDMYTAMLRSGQPTNKK